MTDSFQLSIPLSSGKKFAEDSNDFNPIHLDSSYSTSSLYGEPIVHGINLVTQVMLRPFVSDFLLSFHTNQYLVLGYSFPAPTFYEEQLNVDLTITSNQLDVIVTSLESKSTKLKLTISESEESSQKVSTARYQHTKDYSLYNNQSSESSCAYPYLIKTLNLSSFIVGEIDPGLNSIYLNGKLFISVSLLHQKSDSLTIQHYGTPAKKLIRKHILTYSGNQLMHSFTALPRPYYTPKDLESGDIKKLDARLCSDDMTHLIIGGSSGLGQELQKIFEHNQVEFLSTSRRHTDKKVNHILYYDPSMTSLQQLYSELHSEKRVLSIYYLLSSRILPDKLLTNKQKKELRFFHLELPLLFLSTFKDHYGSFPMEKLIFNYPSTSFIDETDKVLEFNYYVTLKLEAESLFTQHACSTIDINTKRLKALSTRQNLSLSPSKGAGHTTLQGAYDLLQMVVGQD